MGLCTPELRDELLDELLKLNFHAYLQVLCEVLRKMGYEEVRLAGRTGYVGRNSSGGADILACKSVPSGRRSIVIQAKQFSPKRQIFQRSLDELRGVVLRSSAAEGIFITTSTFSESVDTESLASASVVPLRFIDGAYLADQMALYRVGAKKLPACSNPEHSPYLLDRRYFTTINSQYAGVARSLDSERRSVYIFVGARTRKRREVL